MLWVIYDNTVCKRDYTVSVRWINSLSTCLVPTHTHTTSRRTCGRDLQNDHRKGTSALVDYDTTFIALVSGFSLFMWWADTPGRKNWAHFLFTKVRRRNHGMICCAIS